jgi:hypothetical protein
MASTPSQIGTPPATGACRPSPSRIGTPPATGACRPSPPPRARPAIPFVPPPILGLPHPGLPPAAPRHLPGLVRPSPPRPSNPRPPCRMDLPGPTASVGTRTDYSVGPWDYSACATRHLMAWGARTTVEKYSDRKLYMSSTM